MIRMAVLFIQIAILVFAGVWLANEPGVVTVVWRDWRVDTAIGVIALVLGLWRSWPSLFPAYGISCAMVP